LRQAPGGVHVEIFLDVTMPQVGLYIRILAQFLSVLPVSGRAREKESERESVRAGQQESGESESRRE
jgi:hypothetical protein